jgi:hypothetical protein
MEANQLPTKVGPYYWRESDGGEFQLVTVELHIYSRNPDVVHLSCYSGKEMRMLPIKDLQGQWLPVPTAEELVELQAKAKMVDEGDATYGIYNGKDEFMWSDSFLNLREKAGIPIGYTCRKVRVCKEVENEKGTE